MFVPLLCILAASQGTQKPPQGDPAKTEVWNPVPKIVTPGPVPSDAISLGTPDAWHNDDDGPAKWTFQEGIFTVKRGGGDLISNRKFGNCQVHVEWRTPNPAVGEGQGRGNSGVFLMERYEVQVLDSYENRTYSNGQAGSIYKQHIPLVNACLPPGEWQTYDIIFSAPRFNNAGKVLKKARVTVLQNGVLILNNVEIQGETVYIGKPEYTKHDKKESIRLQNHGNPVSYRNIWVREL